LLDLGIFGLNCRPAQQIDLVDLETQQPVQQLERLLPRAPPALLDPTPMVVAWRVWR
jgi:hypothetical protein